MPDHPLEEIFHPRSIAVVGASEGTGRGPNFVKTLLDMGFKGEIYPVNPRYSEIFGLKTYSSIKETPGNVDYVICLIGAPNVPNLIDECAGKGVKAVHLFTGRFSETGRPQAIELEQEAIRRARKAGIRLIGPNCMGLYYPGQGIAWDDFPREQGTVGMAFQSSFAAHDFIYMATPRGIRFSKVICYGNAVDLNEYDFLDYFSQDPETKVILMYVEGVKDGAKFLSALRNATAHKPVIILKGGRGSAGSRATASHTASLAGSLQTWKAAITQAGAVSADSLDELLDMAVSFHFLPAFKGRGVGITGSGGGPSVIAADVCEEAGLNVVPLPDEIRETLKSRDVPIWDWIGNPIDVTIMAGTVSPGEMLEMMAESENYDLFIVMIGEPHYYTRRSQDMSADFYIDRYKAKSLDKKPLLAVVPDKSLCIDDYEDPKWKLLCDIRTRLMAANIPVYPTVQRAAKAAVKLTDYYRRIM